MKVRSKASEKILNTYVNAEEESVSYFLIEIRSP